VIAHQAGEDLRGLYGCSGPLMARFSVTRLSSIRSSGTVARAMILPISFLIALKDQPPSEGLGVVEVVVEPVSVPQGGRFVTLRLRKSGLAPPGPATWLIEVAKCASSWGSGCVWASRSAAEAAGSCAPGAVPVRARAKP